MRLHQHGVCGAGAATPTCRRRRSERSIKQFWPYTDADQVILCHLPLRKAHTLQVFPESIQLPTRSEAHLPHSVSLLEQAVVLLAHTQNFLHDDCHACGLEAIASVE